MLRAGPSWLLRLSFFARGSSCTVVSIDAGSDADGEAGDAFEVRFVLPVLADPGSLGLFWAPGFALHTPAAAEPFLPAFGSSSLVAEVHGSGVQISSKNARPGCFDAWMLTLAGPCSSAFGLFTRFEAAKCC